MEQRKRPLSPHLQVYRLPLTAVVSITHRMTGVLLSAGLMLFVISLAVIQGGASSFQAMQSLLQQPLMGIALWLMVYALFFHLCHGVRHLFWDAGEGYEKPLMNYYILLELFVSLALTFISFLFVQLGS
ncbi:MAG: succinate dehydrogenase, cytochrome b556 subunit [Gammaproteobacteria bacterium]|jgi:succinate dehydrogenase / fumarate reductase, cytochrome b subunit|nr:succinate dehydrogenase, cytochrome b556 subunit [Gammaproteobacteria bacterium]MBT4146819.1 succinate dehydrogenase, cytochrome b556 subunit [Gammaproteobacteria bacterium]MBT5223019.1 succinate dehydrogenase, cytochrome b556 subunit [Gammaproteobacteria bacterium]MBT5825580.1 succinate dehydrogenase, cytochrome b556 subunit [Gammaproteobacteria bacterium]MBT5967227.1 succinate dehydrogenase, cytochrome b556 subunit [Gammaproteobacteria bacterium]